MYNNFSSHLSHLKQHIQVHKANRALSGVFWNKLTSTLKHIVLYYISWGPLMLLLSWQTQPPPKLHLFWPYTHWHRNASKTMLSLRGAAHSHMHMHTYTQNYVSHLSNPCLAVLLKCIFRLSVTKGFNIQMFMSTSFIKIRAWGNVFEKEKRILPNHLKDAN